ncbi:MAG: DUF11 domain-containing protein [Rhodocyclaceae bacterium]|nr:DUF11 domain-containing protein [Rhodocyclaceae bacterium]MDZ4215221.1 DUF11 domain-containing protein [Rhodocyclaceae bacterium]
MRRLLHLLLSLLLAALAGQAVALCSQYAGNTSGPVNGKVVINEYNYAADYIELKILDPAFAGTAAMNNMVLSFYRNATPSNYIVGNYYNNNSGACGSSSAYIKIPISGSVGNDSVVVLWEDSSLTHEVDFFRVGQNSYPSFRSSSCFAASEFAGTSYTHHQSALTGSAARKDIARSPDGTGVFLETPYSGSDQGTPCTSNDGVLAITKNVTSGASIVWLGENIMFRISVRPDARAANQTNVAVTDQPASTDFGYVGHTASTQSATYVPGSGDYVWNIGNLSAGSTATLDLTLKAKKIGTLSNTATVQSDDFPIGTVGPAVATISVLGPTISVTANPTLVIINSNTTFTITVTNPSATLTAPAFSVGNVLTSGLSYVSHTAGAGSFDSGTGTWSLTGLAPGASATLTVVAKVTQIGTFTDTATITMNGFIGDSASATVSGAAPVAFDAFVGTPGRLPTQVVGVPFAVEVESYDDNGAASPYTGNLALALEYCSNVSRPAAGSIACGGSWTAVPGATATASFSNVSRVSTTIPAIGNAYEIVRIKQTPPTGSAVYAIDYFAVRPASLTLVASDASDTTAGTSRLLTAGGSNLHKAGWPFTLTASSTASNYPGSVLLVAAPVLGINLEGNIAAVGWTATSGGMVSSNVIYDDVGNLTLTLTDQHYADIDVADSSTALRYVTGSANIGRFVPDHLTTAVTLPCAGFHYAGQPFTVVVSAYAKNQTGTNTLKNYDATAGFSKTVILSNAGDTSNFSNNTLAAGSFTSNGVGTATAITYSFPVKETAVATVTLRAVDDDAISSAGQTEGTVSIRSGRVRLANAFGSELLALSIPVSLEYWDGIESRWRPNTLDTCTAILSSDLAFAFPASTKNQLVACETAVTSVSGTAPAFRVNLAAPGSGNYGWTDLTLNLALSASGNRCTSVGASSPVATTSNKPWLQFNWAGSGAANPTARAGFGLYNQSVRVIDRREVR